MDAGPDAVADAVTDVARDSATGGDGGGDASVVTPDVQALHVTMRDGTRIAIDVRLDPDRDPAATFPVLFRGTRYWRALEELMPLPGGEGTANEAARAHAHGYALVVADARGSGASYGVRRHPTSEEEVLDYGEIVDWIVAQPWSDGTVVAYGTSYAGNVADLVGLLDHPAVKAVSPQFSDVNPYTDLFAPGGVRNERFVEQWSRGNIGLDNNDICAAIGLAAEGAECGQYRAFIGGVKPVDGDESHELLNEAIAERAANLNVAEAFAAIDYSDDGIGGLSIPDLGTERRFDELERIATPVYAIASWFDAGTAAGALRRFMNSNSPQSLYVGAWSHEGDFVDPFRARDSSGIHDTALVDGMFSYFDAVRSGDVPGRRIHYYTINENVWRETSTWPPDGIGEQTWFLGEGTLSREAPAAETSSDYVVDFDHSTGAHSRWMQGDLAFPDRAGAPVVSYLSDALSEPTRVTGSPTVTLRLSSSHTDGVLYVYLEDVAPDGHVTYLSEGILRLTNRAERTDEPFSPVLVPSRTLARSDAAPVEPNIAFDVRVPLLPTSVLFEVGHRIRVSFAGHDQGFQHLPAEGRPTLRLVSGAVVQSRIVLPVATAE